MDLKKLRGRAKDEASMDSRAIRAQANQRFVRETLARRQPEYAQIVERTAEAVVRNMAQRLSAAQVVIVARNAAKASVAHRALATA